MHERYKSEVDAYFLVSLLLQISFSSRMNANRTSVYDMFLFVIMISQVCRRIMNVINIIFIVLGILQMCCIIVALKT